MTHIAVRFLTGNHGLALVLLAGGLVGAVSMAGAYFLLVLLPLLRERRQR